MPTRRMRKQISGSFNRRYHDLKPGQRVIDHKNGKVYDIYQSSERHKRDAGELLYREVTPPVVGAHAAKVDGVWFWSWIEKEIPPPHRHDETFKNSSGREFYDIDQEWREYEIVTKDGQMYTYCIDNPKKLHVSGSGHYVWDAEGVMHFIPAYIFDVVRWKAFPGGDDISIPEGAFNE